MITYTSTDLSPKQSISHRFFQTRFGFLFIYTIFWLLCSAVVASVFYFTGHNLVYLDDAGYQNLPAFHYICDIWDVLLLKQGTLSSIGHYSYTLGQGADLITTLNSYDFTDPICWFTAALLMFGRTTRYIIMIYIKSWLIGISFWVYCRITERKDHLAVLCGALTYTFSASFVFMLARHPNYINWAFFLPLILAGAELYRRKGKKALLVLSIFLNVIVSFYTFYMNAIMLIIYVVLQMICTAIEERSLRTLGREFMIALRTALLCLTGILLASFILLPTIYAFLCNPRMGIVSGYTASKWIFPLKYYVCVVSRWFEPLGSIGYTARVGVQPLCFAAILTLFFRRGKNLLLKVWFILLLILLCIPMFGRIMNGFGYVSNRWAFAISFVIGLILVDTIPEFRALSRNQRRVIVFLALSYTAMLTVGIVLQPRLISWFTIVLMFCCVLLFPLLCRMQEKRYRRAILLTSTGFIIASLLLSYAPFGANYCSEFAKEGEAIFRDSAQAAADLSSPDHFQRTESFELVNNASAINHVNGTDIWYSLLPSNILDMQTDLEMNTETANCIFSGLDDLSALMELASVKYYTTYDGGYPSTPAGFERSDALSDKKTCVYENKNALPIGYTLDKCVSYEDYKKLDPISKQEVLMQACVLDDETSGIDLSELPKTNTCKLDYKISKIQRGRLEKNTFYSDKEGQLTLTTDIPDNCEIYVRIKGLWMKSSNKDPASGCIVSRKTKSGFYCRKTTRIFSSDSLWPVYRDGVTFNLGTGEKGINKINIQVIEKGVFTIDDIEVYALPLEHFDRWSQKLSSHVLENIDMDGQHISGTINAPDKRVLQFSLPYSSGWTAKVDGQKTKLFKSDIMYMGLALEKGSHKIDLEYHTPFLREGCLLSVFTLLLLILFSVRRRVRRRKPGKDNDTI